MHEHTVTFAQKTFIDFQIPKSSTIFGFSFDVVYASFSVLNSAFSQVPGVPANAVRLSTFISNSVKHGNVGVEVAKHFVS